MLKLTEYEQKMLDGEFGRYRQIAMQHVVDFANVMGAQELVKISKVHMCLGCPPLEYGKSDDFDESFRRIFLCTDEPVKFEGFSPEVYVQSDGGAVDQYDPSAMYLSQELFKLNRERELRYAEGGATIVGSCTPYLNGWLPMRGETFMTTESSNVLFANSVFGAHGNANGVAACAWAAITGRGPKCGMHIAKNRLAAMEVRITCRLDTPRDWDLMGYALGKMLIKHNNDVPVLTTEGGFHDVDVIRIKRMFSAVAVTSGLEICHIEGVTPEAPTVEAAMGEHFAGHPVYEVTQDDIDDAERAVCDEGSADVQLVTIGCPHYSLQELRDVAAYIKGKHVKQGVRLVIWTSSAMREAARLSGYLDTIEAAGATIGTNGCPLEHGFECYRGVTGMVADAAKQAHYNRSWLHGGKMFYGTMEQCVDAAVAGRWEGR